MPEWLVMVILVAVILRVLRGRRWAGGGRCCGGRRRLPDRDEDHRRERVTRGRRDGRWSGRGSPRADRNEKDGGPTGSGRRPSRLRPPPETEEERLQREFVEGTLTVEQYEAALDRMLRRRRRPSETRSRGDANRRPPPTRR